MTLAKHALAGAFIALTLPLLASAAPATVSGVEAERSGTGVVVTWNAAGSDIASYRVYWSGRSILDNNGDYDDSEETDGPVTMLTLTGVPAEGPIFVAVIAVDENGEESDAFTEEAQASSAAPATPELKVTSVAAASANQIRLTFNHDVVLALGDLRRAVRIEDPDGKPLATLSLMLDSKTVLITTAEQRPGKYRITLAKDAFLGLPQVDGGMLAAFAGDSVHQFTSMAVATSSAASSARSSASRSSSRAPASSSSSEEPSSESSSSRPVVTAPVSSSSAGVSGPPLIVTLKDLPRADGFHDIEIGWRIARGVEISELSIAQSVDGGRTFGDWQPLPPSLGLVRVNRIPAGTFVVSLAAFAPDGTTYEPVITSLTLSGRATANGARPPVGSVTDGGSPLASSGPASVALAVTLAAGAVAGARRFRRVPAAA